MSEKSFREIREKLVPEFERAAFEQMEEAAKLEGQLAIEVGHVKNVIPYIAVVVHGSWMKRSYRSGKQDSLSDMACIIGQRTGKILYIGVHNKYCSFCSWYERKNFNPRQHKWYTTRSRDESSGSMEQNIIVIELSYSTEMHDSSVYQSILNGKPYEFVTVIIIECNNHLLRNFCNKIMDYSKIKNLGLPKESVLQFRDMVYKSAYKFRKAIKKVLKKRSEQSTISLEEKAHFL